MSVYAPIGVMFVHIPKTGGSSVVEWMLKNIPSTTHYKMTHPPAHQLLQQHPDCDIVFTAVRNPWARIVSFYTYLTKRAKEGVVSFNEDVADISFERFVGIIDNDIAESSYTVGSNTFEYWFKLSTPQSDWLDVDVTHILKTETLSSDFSTIQQLLGCNTPLKTVRSSNDIPYQQFYNTKTRKAVGKYFEKDIDNFKYTFK